MNYHEIIGYTHSDGYALCPECADYGLMQDSDNDLGYVYPIFIWDEAFYCTCDVCQEVISGDSDDSDDSDEMRLFTTLATYVKKLS